MVRAPDGCWVPAVVPVDTSRAAKDQGVALTDAQVTALGLPADPGEARAWLMRAQADAVRHGDHLDFVVNGRLLHIVDDATSDCGKSCAGGPGHGRSAAVVDHGGLNIVRARGALRRRRARALQLPAASSAAANTCPSRFPAAREMEMRPRAER